MCRGIGLLYLVLTATTTTSAVIVVGFVASAYVCRGDGLFCLFLTANTILPLLLLSFVLLCVVKESCSTFWVLIATTFISAVVVFRPGY